MPGIRLRVGYLPFPDRLYRVLEMPEDRTLECLSYVLMLSFEARCDKLYSYRFQDRLVVSRIDYPLAKSLDERYERDCDLRLGDLGLKVGDVLLFRYGRGVDLHFEIRVEGFVDDGKECRILEGKGVGILEENRNALDYFLENDKEDYLYSPLVGRKVARKDYFGLDFDNYDVQKGNERLKTLYETVKKNYQEATPMLPCC